MNDRKNFGSGALFKNQKKVADTDFDYAGEIVMETGETRWLNAWINESKSGNKYMKVVIGNVKEPKEGQPAPQQPAQPDAPIVDVNDSIPF